MSLLYVIVIYHCYISLLYLIVIVVRFNFHYVLLYLFGPFDLLLIAATICSRT